MVGRIGDNNGSDWFRANVNVSDVAYCTNNGIDYQPCVLPGDTGQRAHGNFMWHQFGNMIQIGAQGLYISMFDEFNEGNQIACTAEDASMAPIGSSSLYFTLDQDGTHCSSDYYLRLTGDGGKMFKGQISLTTTRPTLPALPLIYPTAPTNLTAVVGNGRVVLNWSPVTGAADALSYNVRRAVGNGGSYSLIATNVGLVGFTDTGLLNGTNYYYVVSALNSLGESVNSIAVSVVPQTYYQVNSGGGAASPFIADAFFSGGNTGSTSTTIDTSGVTNPAPQAVYQTERWNNNTYTFTNLIAGASYKVRLHFAEIAYSSAGVRVFNVFILVPGLLLRIASKLGKIQVMLAIIDVPLNPPPSRLDVGIPWVNGVVAVTIVARMLQDSMDLLGHLVMKADFIGSSLIRMVARWTNKLNRH